jgi:Fungal specific transcription factor domain/Fungal Zn(2)-Cys(6) binuclear cluster domain
MSDMQRQGSMSGTDGGSVPLACKPCRDRHVKCDGLQPVCSRCYDSKQYCLYIPSRRGRRPSRNHNKRQRSDDSTASGPNTRRRSPTLTVPDPGVEMGQFAPRVQSPNRSPPTTLHPASAAMQSSFPATPRERSISRSPRPPPMQRVPQPSVVSPSPTLPRLTELYYFYFHDSHPILIPQLFLPQIQPSMMPAPVEAAMYYIGAQYNSLTRDDTSYLQRLQNTLFSTTAEQSRFAVQAMVLLGIAQRAHDRNDLAYETFGRAMDLAIELGMNRASFASENNEGSPVIEEMWRRVWWELYINDAMLAASRQDEYFRMHDVEMDVGLPCKEIEYRNCTVSGNSISPFS